MTKPHEVYSPLETASEESRSAALWEGISRVLKNGYEKSPEIRSRLDEMGAHPEDFRSWEDFTAIPPLSKKHLISLQQEKGLEWFLTQHPGELSRIYQSPGPILDPEGRETNYWGWAEAFFAAGFRKNDLVQMTFSYHLTPAGLMLEEPLRQIGCAVIPAGPGNTRAQIELMTSLPVTGFVGMASYLKTIGHKAQAQGHDLLEDSNLRVAFVAAEILTDSLRTSVEEMFDLTMRQGYGTADVGCIAYECGQLSGWHTSSRCHVEICEPGTGKSLPPGVPGEVVVTPLVRAYPLLRLATGDLSSLDCSPCGCGRTAPRLTGILGRVDDTAKVKGQFIYPAQVAKALSGFKEILAHQTVIDNTEGHDRFTLLLAVAGEINPDTVSRRVQQEVKLLPFIQIVDRATLEGQPPLVDKRTFD
ncbi:phenylacetate--CoA ligase family protein [Desulfoplanes sp.]